jgi:hypothetical protein
MRHFVLIGPDTRPCQFHVSRGPLGDSFHATNDTPEA